MVFWRKKPPKDPDDFLESQGGAHLPAASGRKPKPGYALDPVKEDAYRYIVDSVDEDDDEDEDESEEGSQSGSGGGGRRPRGDKKQSVGESVKGNVAVGGASSKGDGDRKMTDKQQSKIMANASVKTRAMADGGDAMDKARSGSFKTLDSEVRNMSGRDLYDQLSTNPTQMEKISTVEVQQKMIADGFGKQLEVMTSGTYEASQTAGRKEVMNALMAKPISDMTPDEQSFIWDKLVELGQASGQFDGSLDMLSSAVGGFVMSSPSGENLVKEGRVLLGTGRSPLREAFTQAVHNIATKMVAKYHQVLKHEIKPPGPGGR
ncbi:MAG: hypothetical protein JWO78_2067 [Micavibrio sp.]|nr:hypothetical protein [Micavibrio sp.]